MERRVQFDNLQQVTLEDANNLGLFPQSSLDHYVADLGPGAAFTGFPLVISAQAEVTVGAGRLYAEDGRVFYNDTEGGEVVSLLARLPTVGLRYIALCAYGDEIDTDTEPRQYLTNAQTRATVADVTATEKRRWAFLSLYNGVPGPDPTRPAVPTNFLVIAYLLTSPSGVESIEVPEENRAQSIATLRGRLNENDAWRTRTGTIIETLRTDISALASKINGAASLDYVLRMVADLARVKEKLNLPSTYSGYSSDHYLTKDFSDINHVDYLAKVEEGIRFPDATAHTAQIGLLNPIDPRVKVQSNFMLPNWSESTRLSVVGKDSELSISQFNYQTVTWTLMNKTRTRVRWGTPFYTCSNGVWWYAGLGASYVNNMDQSTYDGVPRVPGRDLIFDPIKNIFTRPDTGETFQLLNVENDAPGHFVFRLVQFWVDEVIDSQYWNRTVTSEGRNGSIVAQTFLNSQGGWLTSANIFLSRVATTGDVHCMIVETDKGAPAFDRAIATITVAAADLKVFPLATKFQFLPTYLQKGKRYALVLQTSGNHFVSLVEGNKYTQGTLFQSSDMDWASGDLDKDMAMELNFAKFDNNRCEVQLLGLELSGGIAAIDINVDSVRPDGCAIQYEVQMNGDWIPMGQIGSGAHPLTALPPLLPFRVVFSGTTDEMPGIGVASNSQVLTTRPRSDYRHISLANVYPTPVNTVKVILRLEAWRGAPYHTVLCKLLTGAGYATVVNPASFTDSIPPDDPSALVRTYVFTVSAISAMKLRIEGTTDNVLAVYHVSERIQIGI